ncbi:MAG: alpha/beta hydrolase [Alphaproteobacteria bacterium]
MVKPRRLRITVGDGRRLHVTEYGPSRDDRPVLLCLPGLVRNARDFELLAARLGSRHRVVCPDYRGRGLSEREPNWRRYRPETDLGDMLHIRAARHIDRAVIIGTSYGGMLAMALGVAAPSMLAGVVLNDICPEPEPNAVRALLSAVDHDHVLDSWDQASSALRSMFPTLRFQTDEIFRLAARNSWREGADGRLHVDWDPKLARSLRRAAPPLWPLFASLRRIPALALRGAHSDLLSRACFDRMAVENPDLERIEVPGTAHAPSLEEPEAIAAIDDFLARI